MRLVKRLQARESADKQKQYRVGQLRAQAENEAKQLAAVTEALHRTRKEVAPPVLSFEHYVWKKAPRLLRDPEMVKALARVQLYAQTVSLANWEPRGKGCITQFRSLCDHLFAQYPVPQFLYSVFMSGSQDAYPDADPFQPRAPAAHKLEQVVVHLARGGSLYKMVQDGTLTVPLTRQMCHRFLQSPADMAFIPALRRAQCNVRQAQLDIFLATPVGQTLGSRTEETFWASFLLWLEANPMLAPREIRPLMDYIVFRRRGEPDFSMKGRGANALLRAIEEWHGDMAKVKALKGAAYKPSGFQEGTWKEKGQYDVPLLWRVQEILSAKDLAAEGRALGHCVYSYGYSIESGRVSIWSMTCNDSRAVTIEVNHQARSIIQVRGKFNRVENNAEFRILRKWAELNNLSIRGQR